MAQIGHTIDKVLVGLCLILTLESVAESNFVPRRGDEVEGFRVRTTPLPMSDSLNLLDLSTAEVMSEVKLLVSNAGRDSLYYTFGGSSKLLRINGDSVYVLSEGQRGLFFDNIIPLHQTSTGNYYRCGNAGGIDFREYGVITSLKVPIKTFVPCQGDTIHNSFSTRNISIGAMETPNGSAGMDWLQLVSTEDSVLKKFETFIPMADTLCKITITDNVFVTGYRYPILAQERCIIYSDGAAVDSAQCSFLFPLSAQAELDDIANEQLRLAPAGPENYLNHQYTQNSQNHFFDTTLSLSAFPNVTEGDVTLTIGGAKADKVYMRVLNASGSLLMSREIPIDQGGVRLKLFLGQYPVGIYLVNVSDGVSLSSVRVARI